MSDVTIDEKVLEQVIRRLEESLCAEKSAHAATQAELVTSKATLAAIEKQHWADKYYAQQRECDRLNQKQWELRGKLELYEPIIQAITDIDGEPPSLLKSIIDLAAAVDNYKSSTYHGQ